jgi:hypothetical protein
MEAELYQYMNSPRMFRVIRMLLLVPQQYIYICSINVDT